MSRPSCRPPRNVQNRAPALLLRHMLVGKRKKRPVWVCRCVPGVKVMVAVRPYEG